MFILKALRKKDGFTLIELMVVIAVLGILAAIAVPRLGGISDKAILAEGQSAMDSINTALELYYVDHDNEYPDNDDSSATSLGDSNLIDDLLEYLENGENLLDSDWKITYNHDATGSTARVTLSHTNSDVSDVKLLPNGLVTE